MGYEPGITEVGPAEYPLIEVLRRTIFDEFGHQILSTLEDDLPEQQDVLCLIAHLEGNPIGFKVGHRDRAGVYYSKCGGVLKDYRRLGLATRMHQWQITFAKARGYYRVWFNTFNYFQNMVRFGLRHGFLPVSIEQRELGRFSWKFALDLNAPTEQPKQLIGPVPTDHRIEIAQTDAAALLRAIDSNYQMIGLRYDSGLSGMVVELERGISAGTVAPGME
jgi:GNAT superfamily N-acetyltransferase